MGELKASRASTEQGSVFVTAEQREWVDLQRKMLMGVRIKKCPVIAQEPEGGGEGRTPTEVLRVAWLRLRRVLLRLVEHRFFDHFGVESRKPKLAGPLRLVAFWLQLFWLPTCWLKLSGLAFL